MVITLISGNVVPQTYPSPFAPDDDRPPDLSFLNITSHEIQNKTLRVSRTQAARCCISIRSKLHQTRAGETHGCPSHQLALRTTPQLLDLGDNELVLLTKL